MTEPLKPCPFCGGEPIVERYADDGFSVTCPNHRWHKSGASGISIAGDIDICASLDNGEYNYETGELEYPPEEVERCRRAAIEAWNTRVGSTCRIEDSDLPKTSPLSGIPRIKVYDGDGRKCADGYYVFHQNRQLCVFGDKLKPDDCDHLIVTDGFADWNMPRGIEVKKIVPDGGWVEVVSDAD